MYWVDWRIKKRVKKQNISFAYLQNFISAFCITCVCVGGGDICSGCLKGDSCSLCRDKNTGAHSEKMVLMHFKSALDQQFLLWAHTSPRLQTHLLEVRGTELSSWQTEASAELPHLTCDCFIRTTAPMWSVWGHKVKMRNMNDCHRIQRPTTRIAHHLLIMLENKVMSCSSVSELCFQPSQRKTARLGQFGKQLSYSLVQTSSVGTLLSELPAPAALYRV